LQYLTEEGNLKMPSQSWLVPAACLGPHSCGHADLFSKKKWKLSWIRLKHWKRNCLWKGKAMARRKILWCFKHSTGCCKDMNLLILYSVINIIYLLNNTVQQKEKWWSDIVANFSKQAKWGKRFTLICEKVFLLHYYWSFRIKKNCH